MKIASVKAAERQFSGSPRGTLGVLLSCLDGSRDWHPVSTAPFNRDLEVRVRDEHGVRAAPFPCRQTAKGWVNADLDVRTSLMPVAWRPWAYGA